VELVRNSVDQGSFEIEDVQEFSARELSGFVKRRDDYYLADPLLSRSLSPPVLLIFPLAARRGVAQ
jgi:hypothetical protein